MVSATTRNSSLTSALDTSPCAMASPLPQSHESLQVRHHRVAHTELQELWESVSCTTRPSISRVASF